MEKIVKVLKNGGVGVIPTDTIYGIVGSALRSKTVERIYTLRKRNLKKPMIILISSQSDLQRFGIKIDKTTGSILKKIWPGKVSVVLPVKNKKFAYLHRGKKSIAFRLPAKRSLYELLKKTGPLVAPSANIEGEAPAKNIKEAKKYFGDKIDFYKSGGALHKSPSTLIALKHGKMTVLREGSVKIKA